MSKRLAGKVAVVTGSSKGIGAAIARAFGAEGASVVVNYASDKSYADRVVADIVASGGKAIAVQASMRNAEDIERLFAEADQAFGRLDILVNNAGIYGYAPVSDIDVELFRKFMELNVLGYMLAMKEALPYFDEAGGSVINISSTINVFCPPEASMYASTKGAIDAITRVWSNELAPRKIRVNAIKPGVVETDGVEAGGFLTQDFTDELIAVTPLRRLGKPEDVAHAAVYLASDESSWSTGEYITLSGGHR